MTNAQETEVPVVKEASPEVIAAFNAGYTLGRRDGNAYPDGRSGDAPDRATRRRQWIKGGCTDVW